MCRVHLHKRIQKPHAFRRHLLKATHAAIFCPLMGVAEARTGRSLGVAEAIFCDLCDMWVNGVGQWKEHKGGEEAQKTSQTSPSREEGGNLLGQIFERH